MASAVFFAVRTRYPADCSTCEVTSRTNASSSTSKVVSVPPRVSFSERKFHSPASSTRSIVCTHIAVTSTIACQPSNRRFHPAPIQHSSCKGAGCQSSWDHLAAQPEWIQHLGEVSAPRYRRRTRVGVHFGNRIRKGKPIRNSHRSRAPNPQLFRTRQDRSIGVENDFVRPRRRR